VAIEHFSTKLKLYNRGRRDSAISVAGLWNENIDPKALMGRRMHMFLLCMLRILMRSASLISIVLVVSALMFAQTTKAASTNTAFDGTWSVAVIAYDYKNPDGTVARGSVKRLSAKVKNGVLHGESGVRGVANWYELNGKIAADGTALLHATGTFGNPAYTVNHPTPNKPWAYDWRRCRKPLTIRSGRNDSMQFMTS